jgi:hypothetical protein
MYTDVVNIFCAYAFTGEDLDVVTKRMRSVVDALNQAGHSAYCNRFDPVVDEIQKRDDIKAIFERVTSPNKSIGQIMEIGIAMSQSKPVYLLEHTSAAGSTYLPKIVTKSISWSTDDELIAGLKTI